MIPIFNKVTSTVVKTSKRTNCMQTCCRRPPHCGLVLGAYENCNGKQTLTSSGLKFDQTEGGAITRIIEKLGVGEGRAKLIHNLGSNFNSVAVVGLGLENKAYSESEMMDENKESIRIAAAAGAQALQEEGANRIFVEGFTNTEAAAEGATLGVWRYQEFKSCKVVEPCLELYDDPDGDNWCKGRVKAEAQNIARLLAERPANIKKPMRFGQCVMEILCNCSVNVELKDRKWMCEKEMLPALAMARGACEEPIMIEMTYCGGGEGDTPIMLIGKGVTFDTGGVCLWPCKGMSEMRGDLAGGAAVVAILKAVAELELPLNVMGLVAVMDNMPGAAAIKPGDVVTAANCKTIRVENTRHDGRVALASVLLHASSYKPCLVIEMSTLSMGSRIAMGSAASPTFSTSDFVWSELQKAGADTGDRVWRMPLWDHYSYKVRDVANSDIDNIGSGRGANSCKAAAFLREFIPKADFVHIDISGTGLEAGDIPIYYRKGLMSGRPVRTVIQFLSALACAAPPPV